MESGDRLGRYKIKEKIGPNLEFMISGSAPLSEDTQRWFQMIGIPVYQAYGLTETTGIVSLDDPDEVEPGRVGVPLEGQTVEITEEGELREDTQPTVGTIGTVLELRFVGIGVLGVQLPG